MTSRPSKPFLRFPDLLVAAALAVYAGLVLPLQTFVPNTSNFDFALGALLPELVAVTLGVFVSAGVLLWLSNRYCKGYLLPVLVTLVMVAYLDAGVLSLGVPEINGELPAELDVVTRKIWDSVLTGGLLVLAVGTFRWTRTWLHWVAAGVLVMGLASLLDLRTDDRSTQQAAANSADSFSSVEALADNLAYSPKRNVLMLVLDAMPGTAGVTALEKDPALQAHFPGFTCYRQNVGMHDRTERAVPGMFTGEYYDVSQNPGAYMMTALGTNSFLRTYQAQGYAIYSMLDFFTYGFTTERIEDGAKRATPTRPLLLRPATEIPHLPLANVVAFRLVPFAVKGPLLKHDIHKLRMKANLRDIAFEHVLYPKLAKAPLRADARPVFAKFHTHGAHSPFCYELDGTRAKRRHSVLEEVHVASSNALVHAARLLDAWRKRGLYDTSFIVICADHGRDPADPFPCNVRASAFLMVKPEGAQAPFVLSDAPTGHQNLCKLMKTACVKTLGVVEVTDILKASQRLYREYDRHANKCRDWIYHEDGSADGP